MNPSKEWINTNDRLGEVYTTGVESFLDYAFTRLGTNTIRCPCTKCLNGKVGTREEVRGHLFAFGFLKRYTFWYHHGEGLDFPHEDDDAPTSDGAADDEGGENIDDDMLHVLRDFYPNYEDTNFSFSENREEEPNDETNTFYKLLKDSQDSVYEGCKISKMSALVKLLHMKTVGGWSNESFTMLLTFLKSELLPSGSILPDSYYEAKKFIKDLGLSYDKIDACPNDCLLYWKENEKLDTCRVCGVDRWKSHKNDNLVLSATRQAQKTLRYFPLKPRLQRLYMCSKTAPLMRWHHEKRKKDGVMRHPADSATWESLDQKFPDFSLEPRNVRLGLASDGFQPFSNAKTPYSIWPVVLVPYNLPPHLCMRQPNLIVSMLIPGPDSPGNAIDIYLQPLIDELQELWETGVQTYDASVRCHFQLRAALLWTINDFPAYAMLSGWSTKGKLACPNCMGNTRSMRLEHSSKECYMGHRRYLPSNHPWRKQKENFDGTIERSPPPNSYSIEEILDQVKDLQDNILTKDPDKKQKISHKSRGDNWTKKSIFFQLPYWKELLLRHNLDVMHIEKNVCDSVLGTLMNIKGKTKDTLNGHMDLVKMNLRSSLHPFKDGDKIKIPPAPYTMSSAEKQKFCHFLKELKVPDGFSSNISYCVSMKDCKISGLKSHDCHVLLEHLIPLAIRGLLTPLVREALHELSMFFRILCAKAVNKEELDDLDSHIPYTLCKLEKVFPPSFFDIMIHLPIHLAREAKLGGPVQFRWMFPFEQYMYKLKSYIRNRARVEASIAEGYLADECMTLCSRYLSTIETKFNRLGRYEEGSIPSGALDIFCHPGRHLGAPSVGDIERRDLDQAHIYVLKNCEEVQPHLERYSLIKTPSHSSEEEWSECFKGWFKEEVAKLYDTDKSKEIEDLLSLSRGPTQYVTSFNGYVTNGFRFNVERRDKTLRTQNCGVVVVGNTGVDDENIDYYGIITEIIELQYLGSNRVVLFRCKWFDVFDKARGIKIDEYDVVSVNCNKLLKTNDPYILASQARQVFYAIDNVNKGWHVVLKTQPRNLYEELSDEDDGDHNNGEAYQQDEFFKPSYVTPTSTSTGHEVCTNRRNVEAITIDDVSRSGKKRSREKRRSH